MNEIVEPRKKGLSVFQGRTLTHLCVAFDKFSDRFSIHRIITLRLDGVVREPHLASFPKRPVDWLKDEEEVTETPLLVVDVLSRLESLASVLDRATHYLFCGVKSYWIVIPELKTVTVFSPKAKSFAEGSVVDEINQIAIPISSIFR